jgi:uncharacterized phage protein gp47/JayE
MADIPTILELQSQIENDIRSKLEITVPWYGKVMLRVLALVQAARLKLIYLRIASVQKNIFPDTAESENQGGTLERFGRVKLNRDPFPAQSGIYTINITGISGGIVTKGQTFKSSLGSTSPNFMFEVVSTVTLSGTTGQCQLRALTPGMSSVLQASDEIESTSPIANVNSKAVVYSVNTTPVNAETLETYRQAIIRSFQLEPQGGSAADYKVWAADAVGVRTVYPYTKNGAIYTVQVFVEATEDNTAPGQPVGVPPSSMITEVESVIEIDPDATKALGERGRRPLQAVIEVLPVVPVAITVTINDLSNKSTSTLNLIRAALTDYFYTIRPYIAGADGNNKKDTIYVSGLISAIYNSIGSSVNFSNISFSIDGTTYAAYTFGNVPGTYGHYPYLITLVTP